MIAPAGLPARVSGRAAGGNLRGFAGGVERKA